MNPSSQWKHWCEAISCLFSRNWTKMLICQSKALWTLHGVYLVCLTQDQNISSWVSTCRAWTSNCIIAYNHTTHDNTYQQGSGRKALSSVQKAALLQRGSGTRIWSRVCELSGKYNCKGTRDGAAGQRQYKSCEHPAHCSGFTLVSSPASNDATFNVRPQFFIQNHYKQATQKTKPWKLDAEEFQ